MKSTMIVSMAAVLAAAGAASATVSFTGTQYNQNFNTLGSTTSTTALTWANDSTIPGWSLFNKTSAAITTYLAHNGSVNNGSFYSFGSDNASDRALGGAASGGAYFGSPASGAVAGWIAVAITNNTGKAGTSFTVGFDGEQWRDGGNTTPVAQTMVLEYGFGTNFTDVTTWTAPGGNFNWASPTFTATAGALDGNAAANRVANRGGTVTTAWAPGATLWVRWVENNDAGNDHGLAIDNFTFNAVTTPAPASVALIGLGGLVAARRRRA